MTIPHKTTPEQIVQLATIVVEMDHSGLDREFIVAADELGRTDQGVFDLMALWLEAEHSDRDEIVADIQDAIDDYSDAPQTPQHRPKVPFADLGAVADNVRRFKDRLRATIDSQGGVSAVARLSGIPQPSLSRMLNSASMPRRTTLFKIANALGLPEKEIVAEWVR